MFEIIPWEKNSMPAKRNDIFDQALSNFFNCSKNNFSVDLKESDKEYIIEADLPGFEKDNINISYEKGYLTISAKRTTLKEDSEENFVKKERTFGEFSRSFYMNNVDEDKINAKFENGVLKINLPKIVDNNTNKKKIKIE